MVSRYKCVICGGDSWDLRQILFSGHQPESGLRMCKDCNHEWRIFSHDDWDKIQRQGKALGIPESMDIMKESEKRT